MAKRKLGASVIILCIAAITLISGTYAWFLVGGTAKLFDLGFGVIEANGALELRGDDSTTWSTELKRTDFKMFSFITDEGAYKPVSSKDGLSFLSVGMQDHAFQISSAAPIGKTTSTDGITNPNDVCYNDFTFFVRAIGEEIVASEGHGAYMQIKLGGYKKGENEGDPLVEDGVGAAHAARVAVTIGSGAPVIYDVDGETTWNAVTSTFADGSIVDADPYNQIIDSADSGNGAAGLTPVSVTKLTDGEDNAIKIYLGNIPGASSADYATGKQIRVQIWLEGNDKECIDFTRDGATSISGSNLLAKLTFAIDQ